MHLPYISEVSHALHIPWCDAHRQIHLSYMHSLACPVNCPFGCGCSHATPLSNHIEVGHKWYADAVVLQKLRHNLYDCRRVAFLGINQAGQSRAGLAEPTKWARQLCPGGHTGQGRPTPPLCLVLMMFRLSCCLVSSVRSKGTVAYGVLMVIPMCCSDAAFDSLFGCIALCTINTVLTSSHPT